mgnify:CR=1 FL=1
MTREHISLVYTLRIPMFIVYTKTDLCPPNIYKMNLDLYKELFLNHLSKKIEIKDTKANSQCSAPLSAFFDTRNKASMTITTTAALMPQKRLSTQEILPKDA